MEIPDIIGKNVIFVESREAVAVEILNIVRVDDQIKITLQIDMRVKHKRSWREEQKYVHNDRPWGETWTVSCSESTIVISEELLQGPQIGWQIFINERTYQQFAEQDDEWTDDWF